MVESIPQGVLCGCRYTWGHTLWLRVPLGVVLSLKVDFKDALWFGVSRSILCGWGYTSGCSLCSLGYSLYLKMFFRVSSVVRGYGSGCSLFDMVSQGVLCV